MIVKLAYKNEIRICSSISTFASLLQQVKTIFPCAPSNPQLFYVDSDGDKITISSTSDIESLKSISNGKIIKIQIDQSETKETSTQNSHEQVPTTSSIEDDENFLKQIISANLATTYNRAIHSFEIEEEEMIQDLAKFHINYIGQKALRSVLAQTTSKQVEIQIPALQKHPRSKSFDYVKSEKEIEKLVDRKIKLLIPSLVERVATLVELRSQRQNNKHCDQCSKFKRIISQNLLSTTNVCNEEEFEEIFELISENKPKRY